MRASLALTQPWRCAQTSMALAVAEQACGFEHRDLHWGNLLMQRGAPASVTCRLRCAPLRVWG